MRVFSFLYALRVLRFRLAARRFGARAEDWLLDRVRDNYRIHMGVLAGELMCSRNPEFSRMLLRVLIRVPSEELEADEHLQRFFRTEYLHASSVYDGLHVCQSA